MGELGDLRFISFLVLHQVCYRFVAARCVSLKKIMGLNFVGEGA